MTNRKRKNRRMFTTEELKYAAKILSFFAPPPKCVCGSREFKFGIFQKELHAFCLKCNKHYVYDSYKKKWHSGIFEKVLTPLNEAVLVSE